MICSPRQVKTTTRSRPKASVPSVTNRSFFGKVVGDHQSELVTENTHGISKTDTVFLKIRDSFARVLFIVPHVPLCRTGVSPQKYMHRCTYCQEAVSTREEMMRLFDIEESVMSARRTDCVSAAASAPHQKALKCQQSRARSGRLDGRVGRPRRLRVEIKLKFHHAFDLKHICRCQSSNTIAQA